MQSSVSAEPRRLGDLPRTFSNGSVHISQEVSITSSREPTPPVLQKSLYSSMPPVHIQRPQTLPYGAYPIQVSRWNSLSKNSEKSTISQMRRRGSVDHDLLESNRESMKALADFLMTKEPPPNNWVSRQSSDDDSSLTSFKRSAFKLFGKSKKKKSKTPRLMQLPDSAVAARTSRGVTHIAISIPLEHDHMESERADSPTPGLGKRDVPRERTDRAAVHVLKPLVEVRESISSNFNQPRSRNRAVNPLAINPPDEAPSSSTAGGTYLNYKSGPRIEPSNAPKHDPKRTQKSYVAVSPTAIQRQDSQRSADPRHSGGTVYSTISVTTPQAGHSRQPSSVSTAPSATAANTTLISGVKLELPPRNSSISKVPKSIQEELAQTSAAVNAKSKDKGKPTLPSPPLSPIKAEDVSVNFAASSNSPPTVVVGLAEMGRKYSGMGPDGPQLVRSTTPRSLSGASAPPNKSLPEIPTGGLTRPRTAPPFQAGAKPMVVADIGSRRAVSTREKDGGAVTSKQIRQEKVKAKKLRDMEALRWGTSPEIPAFPRSPLLDANMLPLTPNAVPVTDETRSSRIVTPPRNPKRTVMSSTERRKRANTVTPVMIVVDLPPHTGFISQSDFTPWHQPRQPRSAGSQSTIRPIGTQNLTLPREKGQQQQTPPHSPATPAFSDFPQIPNHYSDRSLGDRYILPHERSRSFSPERASPTGRRGRTQSLRSSVLETRRQERRTKRNLSLREKELDARLSKIERDNSVLLQTLAGIAKSFGHLHRATRGLGEKGSGGEEKEDKVGSVMRRLQGEAPRVSEESLRQKGGDDFDVDEDEDDFQ